MSAKMTKIKQSKATNNEKGKNIQSASAKKTPTAELHPLEIIQRVRMSPSTLTYSDVVQLQRTIGNRAVFRLLSELSSSRKSQEEENTKELKKAGSEKPQAFRGKNKTGIPDNLMTGLENLSGLDLSDVRVHYNSDKPRQIETVAYTQGKNIHIASGQEKHLPHEGWHVIQQKQGRVKPDFQMKAGFQVNSDETLEKEADVMGKRAANIKNSTDSPKHYQSQLNGGLRYEFIENTSEDVIQGVFEAKLNKAKRRKKDGGNDEIIDLDEYAPDQVLRMYNSGELEDTEKNKQTLEEYVSSLNVDRSKDKPKKRKISKPKSKETSEQVRKRYGIKGDREKWKKTFPVAIRKVYRIPYKADLPKPEKHVPEMDTVGYLAMIPVPMVQADKLGGDRTPLFLAQQYFKAFQDGTGWSRIRLLLGVNVQDNYRNTEMKTDKLQTDVIKYVKDVNEDLKKDSLPALAIPFIWGSNKITPEEKKAGGLEDIVELSKEQRPDSDEIRDALKKAISSKELPKLSFPFATMRSALVQSPEAQSMIQELKNLNKKGVFIHTGDADLVSLRPEGESIFTFYDKTFAELEKKNVSPGDIARMGGAVSFNPLEILHNLKVKSKTISEIKYTQSLLLTILAKALDTAARVIYSPHKGASYFAEPNTLINSSLLEKKGDKKPKISVTNQSSGSMPDWTSQITKELKKIADENAQSMDVDDKKDKKYPYRQFFLGARGAQLETSSAHSLVVVSENAKTDRHMVGVSPEATPIDILSGFNNEHNTQITASQQAGRWKESGFSNQIPRQSLPGDKTPGNGPFKYTRAMWLNQGNPDFKTLKAKMVGKTPEKGSDVKGLIMEMNNVSQNPLIICKEDDKGAIINKLNKSEYESNKAFFDRIVEMELLFRWAIEKIGEIMSIKQDVNELEFAELPQSDTLPYSFDFEKEGIPFYNPPDINPNYLYEDVDIYTLLHLMVQKQGLHDVYIVPPADNMLGEQLMQRLKDEKQKNGKLGRERKVLVPYNLGGYHWIGIMLVIPTDSKPVKTYVMDPNVSDDQKVKESGEYAEIARQVKDVYAHVELDTAPRFLQNDGTSCGVLTVENLMLAAQAGNMSGLQFIPVEQGALKLREIHRDLMNTEFPSIGFADKQKYGRYTARSRFNAQKYYSGKGKVEYSTSEYNEIFKWIRFITTLRNKDALVSAFASLTVSELNTALPNIRVELQNSLTQENSNVQQQIAELVSRMFETTGAQVINGVNLSNLNIRSIKLMEGIGRFIQNVSEQGSDRLQAEIERQSKEDSEVMKALEKKLACRPNGSNPVMRGKVESER